MELGQVRIAMRTQRHEIWALDHSHFLRWGAMRPRPLRVGPTGDRSDDMEAEESHEREETAAEAAYGSTHLIEPWAGCG